MRHGAALPLIALTLLASCDGADQPDTTVDAGIDDVVADVGNDAAPDVADVADAVDASDGSAADTDLDGDGGTDVVEPPCSEPATDDFIPHAVGDWTVRVDPTTGAWSIAAPHDSATAVLTSGPRCDEGAWNALATGFVGAPNVQSAFGSFRVVLTAGRNMQWTQLTRPGGVVADGSDAVAIEFSDGAKLRFEARDDGNLSIALVADDFDGGQVRAGCRADESFFGLGSQSVEMDLRGRLYPLWTQEQGIGKPDGGGIFGLNNFPEAAYAPMGIWHSTEGWSAITESDGYQTLDLCDADAEAWTLASYPSNPGFVLVAGQTPRDRVSAVSSIIGRPPLPPPWVFAPWNDAVGGPDRLYFVKNLLRDNDIPSSGIWSEDWIGGEESDTGFRLSYEWDWDPAQYPDLPGDVASLHADGFAFLAYFNTFVPVGTPMFEEGVEGGFLVETADGEPYVTTDPAFRDTGLVDLTNPAAYAWFGDYMRTAADELAIDGWMADFTEWMPTDAVLFDGQTGWEYHNRWPLDFQRLNIEVMNEVHADDPRGGNDWVYFARSGWASTNGGTGGLAPTMWAGDQDTDWDVDDGIPTVIPIGAHLGLSGVAVYGSDIAGYSAFVAEPTTKELFYRWTALAAFHPLMRTHHGSSECANWAFDRDAESLGHYGRYARIHTVLYPVFAALMAEATESGLPITRHPWLVEPDRRELWAEGVYEFFVGDDLLVAPVVIEGAASRAVVLPGSGWWPLFGATPTLSDAVPDESVALTVDAATTEIPVFVRPGTALPTLFWAPDSFYGVTNDEYTDLDDVEGQRYFALYPDPEGTCGPATDGTTTVSATGLLAAPDWTTATIADVTVPACDDSERAWPCHTSRGVEVMGSATIEVGAAVISVEAAEDALTGVGYAGGAWGTLAEVPPAPDLASTARGWCESEAAVEL
jgi:alpha-glucosidase (family GH31 glycosyl hydrolase)